jgi:hypothetical protein
MVRIAPLPVVGAGRDFVLVVHHRRTRNCVTCRSLACDSSRPAPTGVTLGEADDRCERSGDEGSGDGAAQLPGQDARAGGRASDDVLARARERDDVDIGASSSRARRAIAP